MPANSSLKSQAGANDSTVTMFELQDQLSEMIRLLDKLRKPVAAAYVQMALDTLADGSVLKAD
jgi:hypothetical protein